MNVVNCLWRFPLLFDISKASLMSCLQRSARNCIEYRIQDATLSHIFVDIDLRSLVHFLIHLSLLFPNCRWRLWVNTMSLCVSTMPTRRDSPSGISRVQGLYTTPPPTTGSASLSSSCNLARVSYAQCKCSL